MKKESENIFSKIKKQFSSFMEMLGEDSSPVNTETNFNNPILATGMSEVSELESSMRALKKPSISAIESLDKTKKNVKKVQAKDHDDQEEVKDEPIR